VGGLEKVFEFNRNFRNEGHLHAPQPRVHDARVLRGLPGLPLPDGSHRGAACASAHEGARHDRPLTYQGQSIDLGAKFDRLTMAEAIAKYNPAHAPRGSSRSPSTCERRSKHTRHRRCSRATGWACCS
jgi:lysyl-tRNA synthetase class 2